VSHHDRTARPNVAAAEAPAATTKPDKVADKFYGRDSAVDKDAKTITIDNQVYHIIDTMQIPAADDLPPPWRMRPSANSARILHQGR
jgi:hypothetical protein